MATNFIRINPAAEVAIPELNLLLKSHAQYIEGVEFTYTELKDTGAVQFYFDYPDNLDSEQVLIAERIVRDVYRNFIASQVQ